MKAFLNSGEFAHLCHTTKDTLLHYDRKGVFRPSFVSENGYRRYGIEQFFEFDLISLLRDTGSSLEDVKHFQKLDDFRARLAMLKERAAALEQERRLLVRRERRLRMLIELTEGTLEREHGVISIEEREASFVRIFPVQPENMTSNIGVVDAISACLTHSEGLGHKLTIPLGVMVPEESVTAGECRMAYLFVQAEADDEGEKLEIPAGQYAVMFHRDSVTGHIAKFSLMLEELRGLGWQVCGHAWLFDQMSDLLYGSIDYYPAKYMVRVERA